MARNNVDRAQGMCGGNRHTICNEIHGGGGGFKAALTFDEKFIKWSWKFSCPCQRLWLVYEENTQQWREKKGLARVFSYSEHSWAAEKKNKI